MAAFAPVFPASSTIPGTSRAGTCDDREVDRFREGRKGGIGLPSLDLAPVRVHGIKPAGEGEEVPEDRITDLRRVPGGPHHGDGLRREDLGGERTVDLPWPDGGLPTQVHPRIDRACTLFIEDDGVQVELRDIPVGKHLRRGNQDGDERRLILRGPATVAGDRAGSPGSPSPSPRPPPCRGGGAGWPRPAGSPRGSPRGRR